MLTAFTFIKFFHVFLAIIAIGANMTYGVWFARANRDPSAAPFVLRGIKFIDDKIANPCYILLLPTGMALVHFGGYSFAAHWISGAMGLWVLAILGAYLGYTPVLRKQIAAVEREGVEGPEAQKLAVRGRIWAAILAVLVIGILILMIFKPA